jgi:hypothetical protein
MVTSPINPMRYWKLEEIQRMLNQIEGYENVVIEFQYQQSDDWTKRKVWECKCGVKEQLVNGQYNWLLKYVFAIEANDEGDARTIAWQEAAERLVTDVWRTSINSFRKQQRELSGNNQFKIALEKMNRTPMQLVDEAPKPSITKIRETTNKTNTNTQTNKTWWTETKLWIVSSIFFITFLTLGWFYPMIALAICLIALGAVFLYVLVWLGTLLLKEIFGLDDDNK